MSRIDDARRTTREEKEKRLSLKLRTEAPARTPGRVVRPKTQVLGPSLRPLLWPIALFCVAGLLYFAKDVLVASTADLEHSTGGTAISSAMRDGVVIDER